MKNIKNIIVKSFFILFSKKLYVLNYFLKWRNNIMGSYDEFEVIVKIISNCPKNIEDILFNWNESKYITNLDHIYWKNEQKGFIICEIMCKKCRSLKFYADVKNYGQVIEKFLNWIRPYIQNKSGEIIGEISSDWEGEFPLEDDGKIIVDGYFFKY